MSFAYSCVRFSLLSWFRFLYHFIAIGFPAELRYLRGKKQKNGDEW